MAIHPLAGKPAPTELLIDVARLEREYYERTPDLSSPDQLVSFDTSGHRGSSLRGTFAEAHILAITQAICGWFAARPSGTENIYKIYAESFTSQPHLDAIVAEARQIVAGALALPGGDSARK